MAAGEKIKIALVRGDSLNDWEGKNWENLDSNFEITSFCSRKNLYSLNLKYPVKTLPSSTDSFFLNNFEKYWSGRFQKMYGLESALRDFNIAHTAEIYYYNTFQAVLAKKLNSDLKVVCTVWDNSFGRFEHNYWPLFATPPRYWREKMREIIGANADGVDLFLPVTEMSAELLVSYGVSKSKISVLTPAIPDEEVSGDSELLDKYSLRGKEIYLAVNRLVREKGIYDLLDAWGLWKEKEGKVLVIVGNGPEKEGVERVVKERKLPVILINSLPNTEVRRFYKSVKCLVLASLATPVWQEQFGFVLAEAIMKHCPVISTYSGAIPEVVGNAGLLVSPGNPVELKDAFEKIQSKEVYQNLKNNCVIVKQKFSLDKFQAKLREVYLNLAQ